MRSCTRLMRARRGATRQGYHHTRLIYARRGATRQGCHHTRLIYVAVRGGLLGLGRCRRSLSGQGRCSELFCDRSRIRGSGGDARIILWAGVQERWRRLGDQSRGGRTRGGGGYDRSRWGRFRRRLRGARISHLENGVGRGPGARPEDRLEHAHRGRRGVLRGQARRGQRMGKVCSAVSILDAWMSATTSCAIGQQVGACGRRSRRRGNGIGGRRSRDRETHIQRAGERYRGDWLMGR